VLVTAILAVVVTGLYIVKERKNYTREEAEKRLMIAVAG